MVLALLLFFLLDMNAQVPGSVEFNLGLYRDMRTANATKLNWDRSTRPIFGIAYEFKLWKNLHFRIASNFTKVNTDFDGYIRKHSTSRGGTNRILYTKEGSVDIEGWHSEVPISFSYYFKPRVLRLEIGISAFNQLSPNTVYNYTKTTYAIIPFFSTPFDPPVVLDEPIVEDDLNETLTYFEGYTTYFIGVSYNCKIKKYQYLSFTLRYGDWPIRSSFSLYDFKGRFLSFSVGYKFN